MAIIGVGPAVQQARRPAAASATQTEATTWLLGVHADEAAVRRAVAAELRSRSRWAAARSLTAGRFRPLEPVESLLWTDELVATAAPVDGDLVRAHALGSEPLERRPFAVVVAPDAVVLRWHRELGGHRDAQLLLQRIVASSVRRRAVAC